MTWVEALKAGYALRTARAGVVVVFVFAVLFLILWGFDVRFPTRNAYSFWAASYAFTQRLSPYDLENLQSIVTARFAVPVVIETVWHWPALFSFIWFFAYLPFAQYFALWFALAVTSYALSFTLMLSATPLDLPPSRMPKRGWLLLILQLAFMITFHGLDRSLFSNPSGVIQFIGLCGYIFLSRFGARDSVTAGFLLSATLIKPQLLYLLYLSLLVVPPFKKRTCVGVFIGFVAINLPALIYFPSVYSAYFAALHKESPMMWLNPVLGTLLQLLSGKWGLIKTIPAVVALLFVLIRRGHLSRCAQHDPAYVTALVIILSLATTPYAWSYDFVLMFVATRVGFSYLLDWIRADEETIVPYYVALPLLVGNVVLLIQPTDDFYSLWVPWLFLAFLQVARYKGTSASSSRNVAY